MVKAKPYIRIERPANELGKFHVVLDDRIVAVDPESGAEVDISHCVTEWHEHSKAGDVRKIEIVLFGFRVEQREGLVALVPEEAATR